MTPLLPRAPRSAPLARASAACDILHLFIGERHLCFGDLCQVFLRLLLCQLNAVFLGQRNQLVRGFAGKYCIELLFR